MGKRVGYLVIGMLGMHSARAWSRQVGKIGKAGTRGEKKGGEDKVDQEGED